MTVEKERLPALVVVWSAVEPGRVGEVALVSEEGVDVALGDLRFHRQRPGLMEVQPPLRANLGSIVVSRHAAELRVRNRSGSLALRVNGAEVGEAGTRIGDTIEVVGELLLFVTERPAAMPPNELTPLEMPFGEADKRRIIGESPAAWELRAAIGFAATTAGHVLITGESGSGKEAVAKAIHAQSGRAAGPFVARNASTIPQSLVDVELFGNAKDYPNPGMRENPGLVGQADGGVLFLDEIGELAAEAHARLLRVIAAYGDYQRLGDPTRRVSNLRLIGATNRPPEALKEDLLARLKKRVHVPSFRERREDIPFFIRKIVLKEAAESPAVIGRYVHEVNGRKEVRISAALVDHLVRMPIQTNYRQIELILGQAEEQLTKDGLTLPPGLSRSEGREPDRLEPPEKHLRITKEMVVAALAAARGKVTPAGRTLGLTPQSLYRLMDAFDIPRRKKSTASREGT